jgi:hypothetical protein
MARRDELAVLPASGPSFTANSIWIVGGSIGMYGRAGRRFAVADRFADEHVLKPGDAHDVSGVRFLDLDPLHAFEMIDRMVILPLVLLPFPWMQIAGSPNA